MCLGIPGKIVQVADSALQLATADVCGVKREINISLICDHDPQQLINKWVLIHVGFAMSIIDEEEAKQTQEALIAMSQLEHEVGDFLGLNQK
ncbi:hydrogenase maturation factor HybG [[Pasteurella] aerogenes]